MIPQQRHSGCSSACVEALESRRLLSAAPIPVLTGAPFVGAAVDTTHGMTESLTISIATERKSGAVSGDFVVSAGGQSQTYTFTGSVNRRGAIVFHARSGSHKTATVRGTTNAAGTTLAGTFVSSGKHNSSRGTFSASR